MAAIDFPDPYRNVGPLPMHSRISPYVKRIKEIITKLNIQIAVLMQPEMFADLPNDMFRAASQHRRKQIEDLESKIAGLKQLLKKVEADRMADNQLARGRYKRRVLTWRHSPFAQQLRAGLGRRYWDELRWFGTARRPPPEHYFDPVMRDAAYNRPDLVAWGNPLNNYMLDINQYYRDNNFVADQQVDNDEDRWFPDDQEPGAN